MTVERTAHPSPDAGAAPSDVVRPAASEHSTRRAVDGAGRPEPVGTGDTQQLTATWVFVATGYYGYDRPHIPDFAGVAEFKGRLVHPQFWPEDLDHTGKRIAVIGSGATAMTLVPALAASGAAHVTMVQRTPTYVLSLPGRNPSAQRLATLLGDRAYPITRMRNVTQAMAFYHLARRFPGPIGRLLRSGPRKALQGWAGYDDKHFAPPYDPWDQRLCVVPDGDLFDALKSGRADIVTSAVERFEPGGIRTTSGELVEADVIVTATGLRMQLNGGATFTVAAIKVHVRDHCGRVGPESAVEEPEAAAAELVDLSDE